MIIDRLKKGVVLIHKEHIRTGDLIIDSPEVDSNEIFFAFSEKLKVALPFHLYDLGKVLFFSKLDLEINESPFDSPQSYDDYLTRTEEVAEENRQKLIEVEKERVIVKARLEEKKKKDAEEKAYKKHHEEQERINAINLEKNKIERLNMLLHKNKSCYQKPNYRNNLTTHLEKVYSDMYPAIKSTNQFCELKMLNKSYLSKLCQQYYFLRYSYGYSFEYKYMYKKALACFEKDNPLKVLSIGCGCGIDYWALTEALTTNENEDIPIHYDGVDPIDWDMKFTSISSRAKDLVNYHICTIESFIEEKVRFSLDYDIIILPKSLSDLIRSGAYEKIKKLFENCILVRNTVLVMGSFPLKISDNLENINPKINEVKNNQNFCELINALNKKNLFRLSDTSCFSASSSPITSQDNSYEKYPDKIQIFLTDEINCRIDNCLHRNEYCDFNKSPITTARNISNSIVCFERK